MPSHPECSDHLIQLAALLHASGINPDDADIHAGICSLLCDQGRFKDAVGAGLVAIGLAPESAQAQAEVGRALFLDGNALAALEPCAKAVTLAPANIGALVTFSAVLFTVGLLPEALVAASDAVRLDPHHFQARANLALALEALGRLDEAEAHSRVALSFDPASAQARHNLAGLRLSRGKLDAESWTLYDARLDLTPQARAIGAVTRWKGEPLDGKTILLHAEQGFGDVIQFARFCNAVKARGAHVILAVPSPLRRLLSTLEGVDEVVIAGHLPQFDIFCPLASLPGILGMTLETVPHTTPYLAVPDGARKPAAPKQKGAMQVGLAWAGNPAFVHDRFRSIDPRLLPVLDGLPGVQFHCLQKGAPPPFPMTGGIDDCRDFADTAALIAELDLVIAVDTAIAHLAGAMGKPVWLLSRFMGCWRWLRDRSDSPWYPSMRIIRQPRPNDWDAVLAVVTEDLRAEAALRRQCPRAA